MDSLGNILTFTKVSDKPQDLSTSKNGKLVKTNKGYAVFASINKIKPDSSGYNQETYMIKVNHELELDFLKYYPFSSFPSMINYSLLSVNNGFYLFGTQQLPDVNDHNWFVMRTDSNGDLLWKKSYFYPNTRDDGCEMLLLDSNTIVLCGTTSDDLPPGGGNAGRFAYPRMLAIDTLGNVKWKWNWDGDEVTNQGASCLLATPDGGYVYGGGEIIYLPAGNVVFKPMIVKLDANFQEEWYRYIDTIEWHTFNDALITSITMSKDSNYIVSGGLQLYIYHGEFSPQGDRLWSRYDSTWVDWTGEEKGKAEGTAILSSGSIISGGEFTKLTDSGYWTLWSFIMKLSPDGCMDTLACWPVATDDVQSADYQLDVYPNPSSDVIHFSLSQDAVLPRESKIIITDILGRKVTAIRYMGGDVAWDVSDFPQGLYFYRLDVGGKVLVVGRVLVE